MSQWFMASAAYLMATIISAITVGRYSRLRERMPEAWQKKALPRHLLGFAATVGLFVLAVVTAAQAFEVFELNERDARGFSGFGFMAVWLALLCFVFYKKEWEQPTL